MPFLALGMTMHVAKRFSHSRFFEWVQQYGITFSAGVPTVINMLLNKPLGYTAKDVPTLRLMSCSIGAAHRPAVAAVRGDVRADAAHLVRHVGDRLDLRQPPLPQEDGHRRPAGAAPGAEDRRRAPATSARPGVEGEITVGGPQMCVGYLLDDGSIDPVLGKRMKTGDLGVMDDEGFVRVTGRTKDLIIRGGVNIAPLEIDEVLIKHPGVAEAAAVGVPDKIYGEEVICYVVAKDRALTEAGVLAHCRNFLPPAKTPKQVVLVVRIAEKRPRQGAARQAPRRLAGAAEGDSVAGSGPAARGRTRHARHCGRLSQTNIEGRAS